VVRFDTEGPVAIITIDRPEVLNALNPEGHCRMAAAFDRFRDDDALQIAILTGAGERAFCVGTDLKALAATGDHSKPASGFAGITTRFDLWKPVIAAVNGLALGGGAEVVAACDLAVMADDAAIGFPEPRVGLAALGGGALQRLPRQLAMKDAMWLLLSGESVSAEEAVRLRLVNESVPRAELMARARAMAQTLLLCAPLAVQATKQVMLQSLAEPDLEHAMHARYERAEAMLASDDAREGAAAFAAKRAPVWRGC
jgi:enoyl-CoA hydratase/carnithine racemase